MGFDRVRRHASWGASGGGASYLPGMHVLEYQGKRLFRKHGVPPPPGRAGMSILVDKGTRLCVSGITGREGTFHTLRNRDYGTKVASGVTPGTGACRASPRT